MRMRRRWWRRCWRNIRIASRSNDTPASRSSAAGPLDFLVRSRVSSALTRDLFSVARALAGFASLIEYDLPAAIGFAPPDGVERADLCAAGVQHRAAAVRELA